MNRTVLIDLMRTFYGEKKAIVDLTLRKHFSKQKHSSRESNKPVSESISRDQIDIQYVSTGKRRDNIQNGANRR